MLWKYCTQYASTFGQLSIGHRTGKGQFFIPMPKKGNAKECSIYSTVALISHASEVMLKILQTRLQQHVSVNFQMFKLDLEKAEQLEIKLPTSTGSEKKQDHSGKTSNSASLTTLKALTVWTTTNCGKFLKRSEYQTTLPLFWKTCVQVKKQHL